MLYLYNKHIINKYINIQSIFQILIYQMNKLQITNFRFDVLVDKKFYSYIFSCNHEQKFPYTCFPLLFSPFLIHMKGSKSTSGY